MSISRKLSVSSGGGGYKYQSLLIRRNSYTEQYRVEEGVLLDSIGTPNSTAAINPQPYTGCARINPVTEDVYAQEYYGASANSNYPFRYGTFSYASGFGASTLFYTASARTSNGFLRWAPDGQALTTRGDIYSTITKYNIATGTFNTSNSLSSNMAGRFSNDSSNIVFLDTASPIVSGYPWSYSTGLGTAYSAPTNSPSTSYASSPIWADDDSFVIIGNICYSWSNGFTTPEFNAYTQLSNYYYWTDKISDNLFLGVNTATGYVELVAFNTSTGFSVLDTFSLRPTNSGLYPETKAVYDSENNKIYISINYAPSTTSAGRLYSVEFSNNSFGAITVLGTANNYERLEIFELFTHKLL